MPDLRRVPTEDLIDELTKRAGTQYREPPANLPPLCDTCGNFIPFEGNPDDMPRDYNPCSAGHTMRFRMPIGPLDDQWGFYKHGCPDRKAP
jgi:hypothetical protein